MTPIEAMKLQASSLSENERAELTYYLLSTLDDPDPRDSSQWESDLSRRVGEIRAGTAKGQDVDEVMRELERRFP
jgi:hypothetical protein